MTAILDDIYLKNEAGDEFLFRSSYGVYTGDIATATGLKVPIAEESDPLPYTAIKELVRAEVITPIIVTVTVTTNGVGKVYRKVLYYDASKNRSDVAEALAACTWPIGKAKGQNIDGAITPVRVKTRT